MYNSVKLQRTISALNDLQQSGASLAQAANTLYSSNDYNFDELWLAVMTIAQLSEKEAMRLTKDWVIRGKGLEAD